MLLLLLLLPLLLVFIRSPEPTLEEDCRRSFGFGVSSCIKTRVYGFRVEGSRFQGFVFFGLIVLGCVL